MPPPTSHWDAPDQFGTFDTFQAKAELWLTGKVVDPGLKKWKKMTCIQKWKAPGQRVNRFRDSIGNDISF